MKCLIEKHNDQQINDDGKSLLAAAIWNISIVLILWLIMSSLLSTTDLIADQQQVCPVCVVKV